MSDVWGEFTADPRIESNARMRAGDTDRDVVRQVLSEAYAQGRLDAEEFEERTDRTQTSRTLGELAPLIDDLVLRHDAAVEARSIDERAVRRFAHERRQALWAFLAASAVCWVIWFATSWDHGNLDPGFPWPVFVMLGTGINLGRVQFMRTEIIEDEQRRLERRQAKKLPKPDDS